MRGLLILSGGLARGEREGSGGQDRYIAELIFAEMPRQ